MAAVWPGARVIQVRELKGDASTRRYWRIWLDSEHNSSPSSAVVAYLGTHDLPQYARSLNLLREPLPEPLYLNLTRFLSQIGVPVPQVYFDQGVKPASPEDSSADEDGLLEGRLILVEDVGDICLLDAARQSSRRASELYRKAICELLRFHIDCTERKNSDCFAFLLAYDEKLFAYEMEEFIEYGLPALRLEVDPIAVSSETLELARQLGSLPRVFSHRDYHGYNLFVQPGGRIRVLDFQDALLAPAAHDLAVMLTTRDTSQVITPRLEADLLAHYLDCVKSRAKGSSIEAFIPLDSVTLLEQYRLAVLQHALKVIGRFARLVHSGKTQYAQYLPYALAQARRILECSEDFPVLRSALCN